MAKAVKPRIVVSKCLEFANCRYNGLRISSAVVRKLKGHVEFVPVCPEVEIGLGVPRDPIRILEHGGQRSLVQPSTGRNISDEMRRFTGSFLDSLESIDGFVLKNRSPSCGVRDVKIYSGPNEAAHFARGPGFFGAAALDRFGHLALEDEGRLTNFKIREHFLTAVYAFAGFREVRLSASMKDVVRFHSDNKLLLMAYNQSELKTLGRIVANHEKRPVNEVTALYEEHLLLAFRRQPRYTSNINVLMHALGYFSRKISSREKAFFLDSLERYRGGTVPLSSLLLVVRSWILRFETEYLMGQTFFAPYPEEFVDITDSGKGRDLK